MKPNIFPLPGDDIVFLNTVNRLIDHIVSQERPLEIYLIRIKNWFDHKWLRFSGIGIVPYDGGEWIESALDEFRQSQLTFPPFTPSRVLSQTYFCWTIKEYYDEQPAIILVHNYKKENSNKNLHRRVSDFSKSAIFVLFSSDSEKNQKGSLMVYIVNKGNAKAWFASFQNKKGWTVFKTKGISRELILSITSKGES